MIKFYKKILTSLIKLFINVPDLFFMVYYMHFLFVFHGKYGRRDYD